MKLKQKVDRKTKAWKITSIRIPFETAQKVETLAIKAGARSATEAIIQILEAATAGVKALPAKKLDWAKKPDASARKQYGKPVKKKIKAAGARKAKKVVAKASGGKTGGKKPKAAPRKLSAKAHSKAKPKAAKAAALKTETPANGAHTEAGQVADTGTAPATAGA